VTVQVVGSDADSVAPLMLQPVPETEYDMVPEPEPPEVVTPTGVPATPVLGEFVMTSETCAAAVNVNATGALDSARKIPEAALVAVTVHVVACVTVRMAPLMVQPVPETA
jgi:hypothetical protein